MNCYKCATPLPDHSKFCMACGADVSGDHNHPTVNVEPDPELLAALQTELGTEFVVEREIGRGGMAIVYLGQDTHLGRKVAIKLLPPMLTFGSGPGFIERFKREARTAATLDHPHIIPVYRVSTGGKLFWYVMKYLPGESLDVLLKREAPLSIERTVEILAQAADALDYAHQNNVVHRDVKPANIMLDKRGRVTVTDFGIAKALETTGLTNSGATIGTPHYMAPEQCLGIKISGAADQYALAVTAYQMLSGQLPFAAESVLELMRMHTAEPPPPLREIRPEVPISVVRVVERGLEKAAEKRFATCGELVTALESAWRHAGENAQSPTTPVAPLPLTEATPKFDPPMKPLRPLKAPIAATQVEKPPPPSIITEGRTRLVAWIGGGAAIATMTIFILTKDPDRPDPAKSDTAEPRGATTQVVTPDPVKRNTESTKTQPVLNQPVESKTVADTNRTVAPPPANTGTKQAGSPTGSRTDTKRNTTSKTTPPRTDPVQRPPAAPPAPAIINVGSRPPSTITINGQPTPSHPVSNFSVPAGRVTIRFQVTDSTGVWTVDTVITVAPGEVKNLGRVPLKRP